ncbi:MAG: ABC transporter substrate-binding protein [Peptostreptococcaceae bacterium]|jgi:peptide/nickel transport system substrate-binding protein|nr:ABC transporter substrate-binding protein [Peptostreptococcaceae bacterium]
MKNINKFIISKIKLWIFIFIFVFSFTFDSINTYALTEFTKKEIDKYDLNITISNFSTMNPILNKEESVDYFLKLVYDSLFEIDDDYNLEYKLASDINISNDFKQLDISLRSDIRWHDGTPINPDDVKFSIEYIKNNYQSSYYPLVSNIDKVLVTGNKNLSIYLKSKDPFCDKKMIFPIIPMHSYSNLNVKKSKLKASNIVGSGIYKIYNINNKEIDLISNEDYYLKKANIKNIKCKIVPSFDTRIHMLESRESDITNINTIDARKYSNKDFNVIDYSSREFVFLRLNDEDEKLQNENINKFLINAIDKDAILKEIYVDKGEVNSLPLHKKTKYYNHDLIEVYNKDDAYSYIQKYAQEKEIKEDLNTYLSLNLLVSKEDENKISIAYKLKKDFMDLKVNLNIIELNNEDFLKKIEKKDYELALMTWKMPVYPQIKNYYYLQNNFNRKNNNLNLAFNNFINSNKDSYLNDYKILQKNIFENLFNVGLLIKSNSLIIDKNIKGNLSPNSFNIYNGIENLDLK